MRNLRAPLIINESMLSFMLPKKVLTHCSENSRCVNALRRWRCLMFNCVPSQMQEFDSSCLRRGVGEERESDVCGETVQQQASALGLIHTHLSCKTPASCCQWQHSVAVGSGHAAVCDRIVPCLVRAWSCSWSCGWCGSGCRNCRLSWIQSLGQKQTEHQQILQPSRSYVAGLNVIKLTSEGLLKIYFAEVTE